jgi:pimeloyl-ACP methyl ester carboxylesterase
MIVEQQEESMSVQSDGVPKHFVVIVPGIMGSKLRDRTTDELVWVDFGSIPLNPLQWNEWLDNSLRRLVYPNDDLEPAGIMDQVIFVPPWAKQEHYSRLIEALGGIGYRADPTRYPENELEVYSFAYDWRQDNRVSARQLGEAIERWRVHHPGAEAWIIAHSNGGLVARWYIEKEGGKDHVGRLILVASPWDGAPKAMNLLFSGFDTLFRRRFNVFGIPRRTRDLVRTFPCVYQLLPHTDPFLRNLHNEPVDLFTGAGWLENDSQRQLLEDGRRFNEELGTTASVETLCFFGRKNPTTTLGMLSLAATGRWNSIEWRSTAAGDGTVPEGSAVHPSATQKLPFAVGHGDIYVNPAVLEILEWELIDKYQQVQERAALTTGRLTIIFEPDQDIYLPGETINLWSTVHRIKDGSPVSGARIEVQLTWRETLPGQAQTRQPQELLQTRLWESEETKGRYEGSFEAPMSEGYYLLRTVVRVQGESPAVLEELVAVEAKPDDL